MKERKLYIGFYKSHTWGHGIDRFISWAIRTFTKSEYSHCEFFYENENGSMNDGVLIGISDEQAVRKKQEDLLDIDVDGRQKWDYIEIKDPEQKEKVLKAIDEVYEETKGAKYDYLGILQSHFFNRKGHNKNKYTCSEWVIKVLDEGLDFVYPKWYQTFSPEDVYQMVKEKIK